MNLKEQIAINFYKQDCRRWHRQGSWGMSDWEHLGDKDQYYKMSDQILSLLKAEIDKVELSQEDLEDAEENWEDLVPKEVKWNLLKLTLLLNLSCKTWYNLVEGVLP